MTQAQLMAIQQQMQGKQPGQQIIIQTQQPATTQSTETSTATTVDQSQFSNPTQVNVQFIGIAYCNSLSEGNKKLCFEVE